MTDVYLSTFKSGTVLRTNLTQANSQESPSGTFNFYTQHTLPAGGTLVLHVEGLSEADAAEEVAAGCHHCHFWQRQVLEGFHAHRALRRLQGTTC